MIVSTRERWIGSVFYALTTKILAGCDKITVCINLVLSFLKTMIGLRAKVRTCGFAKCSGAVRSTKKCEPMLEAGTFILVV